MAKEKITQNKKATKSPKPPKDFQLIKAIRGKQQKNISGEPTLYKANVKRRDTGARKFIDNNVEPTNHSAIFPGQLVMFNYFQPKTENMITFY